MPDIKPGIEAAGRLQHDFVAANQNNEAILESLQHDCRVLLTLIEECLDDISANDPGQAGPPDHNWLKGMFAFDLTGYSAEDIEDFKNTQKLAFQQELDDSPFDGYKIVKFDVVDDGTGTHTYLPVAYLRPMYQRGPGGGNGSGVPTYPPH